LKPKKDEEDYRMHPHPVPVSSPGRNRGLRAGGMTRESSDSKLAEMIYRRSSGMPMHISAEDTPPPPDLMPTTTTQRQVMDEMSQQRYSVTVRVPATTANMGPGFDTVGMALDMWSEFTVSIADEFSLTNEGDGKDDIPTDETNLICKGVKRAYQLANKRIPPLKYRCTNNIPSAAIVGGIIAGLVLSGHRLKCWGEEELLQIAAEIEGHPDNVAPAIYGGVQIGMKVDRWYSERVNLPAGLQVVIFIPDHVGKTSDARKVLPKEYSIQDVVFNIGRVAWLVNALNTNSLHNLHFGVQDRLHQPQRGQHVYKHLEPMIEAAERAGACACYLSGAGPSVLAITSGASGDIFAQREKVCLATGRVRSDRVTTARRKGPEARVRLSLLSFSRAETHQPFLLSPFLCARYLLVAHRSVSIRLWPTRCWVLVHRSA
jgi:homoserine kinase